MVHPHGRGDNHISLRVGPMLTGSPPRAWGQHGQKKFSKMPIRFTPTGVGTTKGSGTAPRPKSVHPHGRGDNAISTVISSSSAGSPPRAWGQLLGVDPLGEAGRFTPTGVRTTGSRRPGPGTPSVHPHGRGDNVMTPVC